MEFGITTITTITTITAIITISRITTTTITISSTIIFNILFEMPHSFKSKNIV
ncbi:MAG: hypothetical protein ACERKV_04855 [Clostridiaceae bacterium]